MRVLKSISLAALLILVVHSANMLHVCYVQTKVVNVDASIPLLTRKYFVKMIHGQASGWILVVILASTLIPVFCFCTKKK